MDLLSITGMVFSDQINYFPLSLSYDRSVKLLVVSTVVCVRFKMRAIERTSVVKMKSIVRHLAYGCYILK